MQAAWMNIFNAVMLIVGSFLAVFATGSWLSGHGGWESISDFYAKAGTAWKTSIMNFSPDVIFGIIFPCLILLVFMCSASQAQNQPMLLATIRVGYPARRILGCLHQQHGRISLGHPGSGRHVYSCYRSQRR